MSATNGRNVTGAGSAAITIWIEPGLEMRDNKWTAFFDKLGIAGAGNTAAEALDSLRQHVEAHCTALHGRGLLIKALEATGVRYEATREKKLPEVPVFV